MPYNVTYTETNNPSKTSISVADETLNNLTSLTFVGKNYAGYGQYVANNFLHLLENFANTSSPGNPVQGQLWFDNSTNQLMVNNDGTETNWTPSGSVQKSATKPTVANTGDIWVDTVNQQLSIYTGSANTWTLVGPLLSQGTVTGQKIEQIIDSGSTPHNIISLYASNIRVATISIDNFIPKSDIVGFKSIKAGITLWSTTTSTPYKFNGTATNADKLGGIISTNYLRSDQANVLSYAITVPAINTGNDGFFNFSTDPVLNTNYLISSNYNNNSIEIRIKDSQSAVKSVAYFSPTQRVGIATTNPLSTLDVNGSITISSSTGILKVVGTSNVSSAGTQTASIQTAGGIYVAKSAIIGNNLTIANGTFVLNNLNTNVNPPEPSASSVILPGYQTHSLSGTAYIVSTTTPPRYDIGSPTQRFRNFYVENFVGNVTGNVTGSLIGSVTGDVAGTATSLHNNTEFNLTGDIYSEVINFNGDGAPVSFKTNLSKSAISSKPTLFDSRLVDELIIHRQYVAKATGYISGTTLSLASIIFGGSLITEGMVILGVDTTPISAGGFIVGDPYTIVDLGTTTNTQWNTIAGTGAVAYIPGDTFTAANDGFGLGTGTAYEGIDPILPDTIIDSGSGNNWIVNNSQIVGTAGAPFTIYIGSSNLYRTTKQTFVQDLPTIKIGAIILYAGTALLPGYLWCDGSEYPISLFSGLYSILGPSYVGGSPLSFVVPTLIGPATGINYIIYSGVI